MTVRTRYAPSPTGDPHLGNIRTALFAWLLARHHGGQFFLRIEDTDQARKVEGAVESQMEALRWLGLTWDEGPDVGGPYEPYTQSERLPIYQDHAAQLINTGHAYHCYCSPERLDEVRAHQQARKEPPRYDRFCRDLTPEQRAASEASGVPPVVRFKTPLDGETIAIDAIRGPVPFQNSTLDDFVILKSDGYPTYHLGAMVDDHLMGTTHILRGEEWLPSAPRHFLIFQAFGWDPPVFAHLSRVLGPDKAKLSKRHGAHAAIEYREQGYLPDAIINFMALLGWSLDDHTEVIDRETLIKHFDLDRVLVNPAVFNAEKLLWLNGVYIRAMPPDELATLVIPFLERGLGKPVDGDIVRRIMPFVQERIKTLSEIVDMAGFFFTEGSLEYETDLLLGKKFAGDPRTARAALEAVVGRLDETTDWTHEQLEAAVRPLADDLGLKAGDLFGPVRVAITGQTAAPPLFETMEVLGREVTLQRLGDALGRLLASQA